MATSTFYGSGVALSSSFKCTYNSATGSYTHTRTSTGNGTISVSGISVPAGSSVNSCTFYSDISGATSYGGTTKVNGVGVGFSGNQTYSVGVGYSSSVSLSASFATNYHSPCPYNPGTYTGTRTFANNRVVVDYTPPTAASLWGVAIDGSGSTQYRGAGAAMTLSWSASGGTNNGISSYSIWYNDNGAGWVAYATGVGSTSYTVYGHPTAGHNRQFLVQAIAPYGSSGQVASPAVYSYSAVGTPTSVSISPNKCFPDTQLTLSWTAPSGGTGTSVTGYDVYENGVVKTGVTGTSYTFTAPTQGSYTYTVKAKANVSGYDSAASAGAALTVDPPASSFTLNNATVAMDGSSTITAIITPVNPAYNHDVTFALDATRTSTANVAAGSTTRTFTIPLNWCVGVPNGTSASATCTVVSKNGSTVIGQTAVTFTVTVPASVVPTVSLTVAPVNGFNGLYLKGKSSCQLTATGAGVQGSTIASRALSGGGYAGTVSPFTTGILNTPGTNTMTAIVTDTRSRQATATANITVTNYDAPVISGALAYRTNSGGTALPTGEYIRVIANLTVSAVAGNSGTGNVKMRVSGGSWGTPVAITNNTAVILSGALQENAYEVMITLTDTVGTVSTYTTTVRKATFMYDFRNDRAAFGQLAGATKTFTLPDDWTHNLPTNPHTHGNITTDGKVGSTTGLPLRTGTNGIIQIGAFGVNAGDFCQGNDSRILLRGSEIIVPTGVVNATLSGSVVTFANVASFSVENAFPSGYDWFELALMISGASGGTDIWLRMRTAGGVDLSTGSLYYRGRVSQQMPTTTVVGTADGGIDQGLNIGRTNAGSEGAGSITTILSPNSARRTYAHSRCVDAEFTMDLHSGVKNTTAYPSFTITTIMGATLTGILEIYGRRHT